MAPAVSSVHAVAFLVFALGVPANVQGCVPTGSTGDCATDGCCDLLLTCTSDGTCVVPEPVCMVDTCADGEVCASGTGCVGQDEVSISLNTDPGSEATSTVYYDGSEISVVTDGDTVTESFVFSEALDNMVDIKWDKTEKRPWEACVETDVGLECLDLEYDSEGNLVSYIESTTARRLAIDSQAIATRKLQTSCEEECQEVSSSLTTTTASICGLITRDCDIASPGYFACLLLELLCDTIIPAIATILDSTCTISCPPTPAPTQCSLEGEECTDVGDNSLCCEEAHYCVENNDFPTFGPEFCCSAIDAPQAHGDPHLVGFRGQKFDFTGQDGGYYALLVDEPSTLLTMKVHAPVPTVSQITYIVGFALKANDLNGVPHTVEVRTNHPENFNAQTQCPGGENEPCLADGALTVLLDGKPMTRPGMQTLAPGLIVGAVNLPGECRPFGFENYWAKKVHEAEMTAAVAGRRLEVSSMSMDDWVLRDQAATNRAECEAYVARAVEQDTLFTYQSEHVSFQIVTPQLSIRANHGKLHQIAMRDPTDKFDLPDHRTFQQNIGLERAVVGDFPQGVLGETTRPILDEAGNPIMFGMSAIRGGEEDYRVSGPFDGNFIIRQT